MKERRLRWFGWTVIATGILGVVSLGRADAPPGRYAIVSDGVTDNETGLTWEEPPPTSTRTFIQATTRCSGKGAGWRVPSMKELLTLVDSARWAPVIDTGFFPSTVTDQEYWTSTVSAAGSEYAWSMSFRDGDTNVDERTVSLRVRCVK